MTHVMKLYPWQQVIDNAESKMIPGVLIFQQFNCEHCGQKLTMETPNHFHRKGTCDQCGKETDIEKNGHNFMLQLTNKGLTPEQQKHAMEVVFGRGR